MNENEKQSLVTRMNKWSSKSFPRMSGMSNDELTTHATILQRTFQDIEKFLVPALRNDFRHACDLMKERKIKSILTAEPQQFKAKSKTKSNGKPKSKRMSKDERIRENGIAALMSVGMSREDAMKQFGVKS